MLEEAKDSLYENEIDEDGKEDLIKRIKETITSDSELYEEAKKVLAQLDDYEQKYISVYPVISFHGYGLENLELKVVNETGRDISYIAVDIFEKENGKIISSDWTNTSSKIKDGAIGYIDTYFDYQSRDSELEIEIRDIRYSN